MNEDIKRLVEAAIEVDRWMLVIESAVRQSAPRDRGAILDALMANSAALTALSKEANPHG